MGLEGRTLSRRKGQKNMTKKINGKMLVIGMTIITALLVCVVALSASLIDDGNNNGNTATSSKIRIVNIEDTSMRVDVVSSSASSSSVSSSSSSPDISFVECMITTDYVVTQQQDGTPTIQNNSTGANGAIEILLRHDLSPIHSNLFLELVNGRHFDEVFIFRVLRNFIAQFGERTAGSFKVDVERPKKVFDQINNQTLSNIRGTLSFAGGNPATQQVFVNLRDNKYLDEEGSRPFATVTLSSLRLLEKLYMGYKDGMGQMPAIHDSEMAVRSKFPFMSQIKRCRVVPSFSTSSTSSTSIAQPK